MAAQTSLTWVEAAYTLGISLATLDQLINAGYLPVMQGRRVLIRSTTIDARLERHEARRGQAIEPEPPDRLPAPGAQAPTRPALGKEGAR